MTVSTIQPLEDGERRLLLGSFLRFDPDSIDSMTAHWIFSTACHPWSLAHPEKSHWKIVPEPGQDYFDYVRAKTYRHTHLPIDPAIRAWAQDFLAEQLGFSEREYLRRVNRFGKLIGLPGLSCRTLRHDCIYRFARAVRFDSTALPLLVSMFGTSVGQLLGYANKGNAKVLTPTFVANGFT